MVSLLNIKEITASPENCISNGMDCTQLNVLTININEQINGTVETLKIYIAVNRRLKVSAHTAIRAGPAHLPFFCLSSRMCHSIPRPHG